MTSGGPRAVVRVGTSACWGLWGSTGSPRLRSKEYILTKFSKTKLSPCGKHLPPQSYHPNHCKNQITIKIDGRSSLHPTPVSGSEVLSSDLPTHLLTYSLVQGLGNIQDRPQNILGYQGYLKTHRFPPDWSAPVWGRIPTRIR